MVPRFRKRSALDRQSRNRPGIKVVARHDDLSSQCGEKMNSCQVDQTYEEFAQRGLTGCLLLWYVECVVVSYLRLAGALHPHLNTLFYVTSGWMFMVMLLLATDVLKQAPLLGAKQPRQVE